MHLQIMAIYTQHIHIYTEVSTNGTWLQINGLNWSNKLDMREAL